MNRIRPGLYTTTIERPDLRLTITITVEKAGAELGADQGYWAWAYNAQRGERVEVDQTAFDYPTKKDAMDAALKFAEGCRADPQWGLVY